MSGTSGLAEHVVDELRRRIREGEVAPGQRLPAERHLCREFGFSRTTVREALKVLAAQGYVRQTPRGAVVTDPDEALAGGGELAALAAAASVRDLYEVRKLIEVRTARWAAQRATAEDVERLRRACDGSHRESVARGGGNPNTAFHDVLVEAAHNPVLGQIYRSSRHLFFRLPAYWRLLDADQVRQARSRRHDLARRWHVEILQAIEARDPDAAAGAMFVHLDLMRKDLLARLANNAPLGLAGDAPPVPLLGAAEGVGVAVATSPSRGRRARASRLGDRGAGGGGAPAYGRELN